jgi:phage terminase small subunit
MPVLSQPRYERFAQGLAKGKTNSEAYLYAGYAAGAGKDVRSNASTLARKPEIISRVAELQSGQAKRIGVTVDHLVSELDDMLRLAKRVKHPAAGVGAILAKGKLLGLIVDKAEVDATVRKPARAPTDQKQMSMDEWQAKFAPPGTETVQ